LTKIKTLLILGTRPEVIKLAPVYFALAQSEEFNPLIINTGQHRDLARDFLTRFNLTAAYDLEVMIENQSLTYLTSEIISRLEKVMIKEQPDLVLVQGDTTSALGGALSAFYHQVSLGHVEAGLRTGKKYNPFPEEMNRLLISKLADWHFAPTSGARNNLLQEGIEREKVLVTGNTIVDTLLQVLAKNLPFHNEILSREVSKGKEKIVTVTAHRRENWEKGIEEVAQALRILGEKFKEVKIFFPLHPNPLVREKIVPYLSSCTRVFLLEPLDYFDFVKLLSQSTLLITDSGGVQEESSALGVPVLITRDFTERPEVMKAGLGYLVGCNREKIVGLATRFLKEKRTQKSQPIFGDGRASWRIVQALRYFFGLDSREIEEFIST